MNWCQYYFLMRIFLQKLLQDSEVLIRGDLDQVQKMLLLKQSYVKKLRYEK